MWISSDEDSFDFGYSVPGTLSLRSKLYFQDQWHPRFHVAGVRDEKELRIYVDGKFQGREKLAQLGRVDTMDSLIIGNAVIGMIDEIRFSKVARYDKDFTPKTRFERDADTLALYHCDEGSGDVLNDSSGNGHHGKIVGAKWVKAAEVPKNATPPTTSEGPADPERKAAESLIPFADLTLELKSGKRTLIRAGGKLPAGPFKVTAIGFSHAYNKDLPATFVGATLLPAIAELQSLTAIRNHFDQVETVTGEELARLSKMPAAKTIKVLWLRFQLTSSAVDSLARFPSLVSIHCMAEQTDGATLSRLKELPKLKELSFLGLGKAGPITDKGIDDLCSLELTSIGIHRSNIVDARLAAKLASMPRVEHIRLGASGVDDAIVAALNRGTAKLTTLDVNTNRVTDAGLAHLKNMTTLRVLSVGFNPKVTEAGAMKLSDALPKCKIELGGGKVIGPKDKTTPPPVEPDDPTPEAALPPLDPASVPLFNGKDLAGWKVMGNPGWSVKDGVLVGETKGPPGWLMSEKDYADFELSLEYKQAAGGDSGVFLRASPEGAVWQFMQIELIDDAKAVDPNARTGALFDTIAPTPPPKATVNEWHRLDIRLQGRQLQVMFDDQKILATNLDDHKAQLGRHPGLGKATGRIGLEINRGKIEFKNIRVRELLPAKAAFPPLDPTWLKAVAAMKPEQQVEAVKAEPTNAIPASTARSSAKSKPVSWPR